MDALPHEKQIFEYMKAIERLRKEDGGSPFQEEIEKLEEKLEQLKEKVYAELTPWQRIMICRHPLRPHAIHYTQQMCDHFVELAGDRLLGNDEAIIAGLAKINELKCILIGQEKGHDTESRIKHNFGMASPEGFRKALRVMKMAEKFDLPIVTLLDTTGANPVLEAEERGQGWAIAANLFEMSQLKVPIIVIVIGEGCSGGALGIGVGDVIGMLEHAYYSVISPEGCASILWKEANKNVEAASALKLNAEFLASAEIGIVDEVIKEPLGGAHHDPQLVFKNVKRFILDQYQILRKVPRKILLQQRYLKFRRMGKCQVIPRSKSP